ncbi:hypothetical protein TRVL_06469 [Trypanosoma vivax]|nr:hypothetical protein TRVL_06469 [Trypanosoma vivax]
MRTRHGRGDRKVNSTAIKSTATLDEFFSRHYGERWPVLRKALCEPAARKAVLWNRFCQLPFEDSMPNARRADPGLLLQIFYPTDGEEFLPQTSDAFSVRAHCPLDYATAVILEHLDVGSFDCVLDMCAGTGGRAVAISQLLSSDASFTVNEQRSDRCARLRRLLKEYVPINYVNVTVTQRNAETWYEPSAYHRVFLDAPCTNERQILQQCRGAPVSAHQWSLKACSDASRAQRSLLLRAIETCRPGGRVLYTTCSLRPVENDDVVCEALRVTRCHAEVLSLQVRIGERTRFGFIILPDRCEGHGPLYCCVIHKVSDKRESSEEDDGASTNDTESDRT